MNKIYSPSELLSGNPYPGRGIVVGTTPDGKKAVSAYFIMGRSANSRNRVFEQKGEKWYPLLKAPDGMRFAVAIGIGTPAASKEAHPVREGLIDTL